jgi:DNA processing protein
MICLGISARLTMCPRIFWQLHEIITDSVIKLCEKLLTAMLSTGRMTRMPKGRISTYTLEELVGPLNDVEKKYVPKELYVAGPLPIPLPVPRSAVIGSRKASSEGLEAARDIARTLAKRGVVVVSGLAEGIDTAAHKAAIESGGRTIAVLGTPLDRVYPRENTDLQELIMRDHLVISQFPIGHSTWPKDFVLRNRTMALISNASIIVEAGDSSGSLHQGWEALRLGRPLFIWRAVMHDPSLKWPEEMERYGAMELSDPEEVLDVLPSRGKVLEVAI